MPIPAIERAEDGSDGVLPDLALSSEFEVMRSGFFGDRWVEILDHRAEAIDFSRAAKRGLPILLDHDTGKQVGRLEQVRLDQDRVIRGTPRFGRSAAAKDIEQDVRDGIRTDVSVGYRIQEAVLERSDKDTGIDYYRVTRWQPLEASLVAVPADPTVGVGRGEQGTSPAIIRALEPPTPQNGEEEPMSEVQDTTARIGATNEPTVQDALAVAKRLGVPAETRASWAEGGMAARQIHDEAVKYVEAKTAEQIANAKGIELSDREQRSYSVARAIQTVLAGKRDGFEFELSDELAHRLGRSTRGFFMPTTISAQHPAYATDPRLMGRTLLSVGTATKGGNAVFTEYAGFIDLLRNYAAVMDLGATMLPGLQGNLQFVTQSGAGTATWGTETGTATASSISLGTKSMSPKVLSSKDPYSRLLLQQSVESIENLIRNDIAKTHALAIDLAAIKGAGTTDQPSGVLANTDIGSVTGGAQGAAPDWADIVDLQKAVADQNALFGSLAYLTTPGIAAKLMKTEQFATTNGAPVWSGPLLNGSLGGFRAVVSNQVPSTGTKGTTTGQHAIIFGNWNDLVIGEWGAIEVFPDELTSGPQIINLLAIQYVDILVRRPKSFAAMTDALPS